MLVAYLPTEKILINATCTVRRAERPAAATGQHPARELAQNIRRLNLTVDRHVPIHGQVGTHEWFLRIVGQ